MQKTVLITGCSSGFGRKISFFLKEKGWRVYATARKSCDVERLREEGFTSFQLDVTSSESITAAVDAVLKDTGGKLDGVVNNAGYCQIGAVEDLSRKVIHDQFATNVFGPMELTSRLIPVFRRQGYGKIVFIGTIGFAFPFMGAEASSKTALNMFCDALRRELRGTGIYVTRVCPGIFHTALMKNAAGYLSQNIDQAHSVYKDIYPGFLRYLQGSGKPDSRDKTLIVAECVHKIMEAAKPKSIIIMPADNRLHDIVNRLLPAGLQDYLLYLKMKYVYKII